MRAVSVHRHIIYIVDILYARAVLQHVKRARSSGIQAVGTVSWSVSHCFQAPAQASKYEARWKRKGPPRVVGSKGVSFFSGPPLSLRANNKKSPCCASVKTINTKICLAAVFLAAQVGISPELPRLLEMACRALKGERRLVEWVALHVMESFLLSGLPFWCGCF